VRFPSLKTCGELWVAFRCLVSDRATMTGTEPEFFRIGCDDCTAVYGHCSMCLSII